MEIVFPYGAKDLEQQLATLTEEELLQLPITDDNCHIMANVIRIKRKRLKR